MKNIRQGLDACYSLLQMSQEDIDDCEKIWNVYTRPASEKIPFNWTQDEIQLIFNSNQQTETARRQTTHLDAGLKLSVLCLLTQMIFQVAALSPSVISS